MNGFLLAILLPVAITALIVGVKFWRETIITVLVWMLFEGAARKWIAPGYQAPLLLVKDVALFAAYCGYLISPKHAVPIADRLGPLSVLCTVFAIYCGLEAFNPNLPNLFVPLYGLKNYLMYIPLAFILPEMCRTREDVRRIIFWICVFAIPLCLLGLYQFSQPATSWVNKYVSHEEGDAIVAVFGRGEQGAHARTSSTFSYLGGFTTFLSLILPLFTALLLANHSRSRATLMFGAALMLAVGATLTTGSRTPVLMMAVMSPMIVLLAGGRGLIPFGAALRLGILVAFAGVAATLVFSDAASAFLYRVENADSAGDRLWSPVEQTLGAARNTPPFGIGIGSNSNAAPALGGSSLSWLDGYIYEIEPARVLQDLGLLGFALLYFIKIYVVFLVAKFVFWSRSKLFIALHLAVMGFLIPHIILFTVNNPTGGLIYWSVIGLSVSIYRLERRERGSQAVEVADTRLPRYQRQVIA